MSNAPISTKSLADIIKELGPCSELIVFGSPGETEMAESEKEKFKAAGISGVWRPFKPIKEDPHV